MASLGFSLVNCMDTISFLVTDIIVHVKMHFNIPKVKMHKNIVASYI